MNYIILDLEWDGSYCAKIGRFINQILQIGAVKLDSNFNIIDTFERTVKSSFSRKVSKRFAELTGITKEIMSAGIPLDRAVEEYNDWVGDGAVTMTWSNSDIYTVIENEKELMSVKFKIEKYLDLQKFIQGEMRLRNIEVTSQISLLNAANLLGVKIDETALHNAKSDSVACAALLKECYNKERFDALIFNTSSPDFFARFTFKPYLITDINDRSIDKSIFDFSCENCAYPLKLKGEWHRHGGFIANMVCESCGKEYIARVKAKKLFDSVKVYRKLKLKKVEENNDLQYLSS